MKIRINQLRQKLDDWRMPLEEVAARALRVPARDIVWARLARKSVDARDKGDVHFTLTLDVETVRPVRLPRNAVEVGGLPPSATGVAATSLGEGGQLPPSATGVAATSLGEGGQLPPSTTGVAATSLGEGGQLPPSATGVAATSLKEGGFWTPSQKAPSQRELSGASLTEGVKGEGGRRIAAPTGEDSSQGGRRIAAPTGEGGSQGERRIAAPTGEGSLQGERRIAAPTGEGSLRGERRIAAPTGEGSSQGGRRIAAPTGEGGSQGGRRIAAPTDESPLQGRFPTLESVARETDPRKAATFARGDAPQSDSSRLNQWREESSQGCAEANGVERPALSAAAVASRRCLVVGMGPAGLFAALTLARAGLRPVVVERGRCVEERERDVAAFWNGGALDPESNVQFGEGGAGTFSDGKLNSGIKDPRCRAVLEEMHRAGAPESILWQAKPHVGTDHLKAVVKNLRGQILALGGDVRFGTRLTGLVVEDGAVTGARLAGPDGEYTLETTGVILAVGHSARDTFEMLYQTGANMSRKPFAIGARIEHDQRKINRAQYGAAAEHPALGAADYKLAVHLPGGRSVYTFCMCPGGQVVAAASEEGGVAVNGMSLYARDGANANSALLVNVLPEDFGGEGPLAGVAFQREWERAAFRAGGGDYRAPAQRVGDFLARRPSEGPGAVTPSYRPGVKWTRIDECLPGFVTDSMREALPLLDRKLKGFADPDAVLTGVETRSSSPVRIERDAGCQSNLRGLYPCGEGAGYAGGIMSAAVDGIRCAEALLSVECGEWSVE